MLLISLSTVPKMMTLNKTKAAMKQDVILSLCITAIQSQKWKHIIETALFHAIAYKLQDLHKVHDELITAFTSDLVLQVNHIVIQHSLKELFIDTTHEANQRIKKMK